MTSQETERTTIEAAKQLAEALSEMHAEVTWMFGVDALDNGLRYQLNNKDDATLALWTSVGLETCTLASVLQVDPSSAYSGRRLPGIEELISFGGRTGSIGDLVSAAIDLYPGAQHPSDALDFTAEIRNKLIHRGVTGQIGIVGRSLRLIRDISVWMSAVDLPDLELRKLWVVQAEKLPDVPAALAKTVERVALDNAEHISWSLNEGLWEEIPDLKPVAERELTECLALVE